MAKTFRVEITATAEADVAEIWETIAHDSPEAATAFILRLEAQIDTLEKFPERCSRLPESHLLGWHGLSTFAHWFLPGHFQDFRGQGDRPAGVAWRAIAGYADIGGGDEVSSVPKAWANDRLKDVAAVNVSSLPANTDANYEFDYLEISNVTGKHQP